MYYLKFVKVIKEKGKAGLKWNGRRKGTFLNKPIKIWSNWNNPIVCKICFWPKVVFNFWDWRNDCKRRYYENCFKTSHLCNLLFSQYAWGIVGNSNAISNENHFWVMIFIVIFLFVPRCKLNSRQKSVCF